MLFLGTNKYLILWFCILLHLINPSELWCIYTGWCFVWFCYLITVQTNCGFLFLFLELVWKIEFLFYFHYFKKRTASVN